MYESKTKRPLSRGDLLQRLAQHVLLAAVLLVGSLGVGIWGCRHFEQLSLETAVGHARVGCDAVRWQGETTLRAHAHEEEQRGQRAAAQLNGVV